MTSPVLDFLLEGVRSMFYLRGPHELALTTEDDAPKYLLMHGIPMFFLMIAFEAIVSRLFFVPKPGGKGLPSKPLHYRFNDMVSCTVLGSFQQVATTFLELLGLMLDVGAYTWAYHNCRLVTVDPKEWPYLTFFALFLGKDVSYYWYHRFLHEFHIGWSAHSVHHSGEDYNLATGLRQGALQPLFSPFFYTWIALLGFPPQAFAAHAQLNTLYMYWIHTDLVDRLPFGLEYVLNSPMAHRMHHRPPGNRNYAGLLIIWDRIFQTYQPEIVRKDHFGLAKQPKTFDPIRLNTQHFVRMGDVRHKSGLGLIVARRVKARWSFSLRALFDPIPPCKEDARRNGPVRPKWDGAEPMGLVLSVYLTIASLFALGGLVWLLIANKSMHEGDALFGCIVALALLAALARICDMYDGERQRAMVGSALLAPILLAVLYIRPVEAYISNLAEIESTVENYSLA